jgi:NADH-quinone oxidoreductase subunit J
MLFKLGFIYLAFVIIMCAIKVISSRNPVHSALFMLPLFFHVAGIFVLLNAEFLAAIQVLVYAGAILVLFLFVVMLLNVRVEAVGESFQETWPAAIPLGITLAGFIMIALVRSDFAGTMGEYSPEVVSAMGNSQAVGRVLYTDFLFPFEVASVILLVAMIGAIVLAKKRLD